MDNRATRLALKGRLVRTWSAFFERHGNFTNVQVAAIPALLDGHNIILSAPTASGKTEAAVAPLVERYGTPGLAEPTGLMILYLTPTRALVNDLLKRLSLPLETLNVPVAVKTRDLNTFRPAHPAPILITTPESLDSLLTLQARVFVTLRAVILDELHLFDHTPRGDHLRVLLKRLRYIRQYAHTKGDAPDSGIQFAALSATLSDPARTAAHYFSPSQVISVHEGERAIQSELVALKTDSSDALCEYLASFRRRGWQKALVFCNSRAEVEAYAAAVRKDSPFGSAVYVHYSNIAAPRRHAIEKEFAESDAAICFATTTLELGIDIGSIDTVLLIGPPGSREAFAQRIGRGNRRGDTVRAVCFYRTEAERLIFEALLMPPDKGLTSATEAFHPSVAVQQMFSLIKQSPGGVVRESELGMYFDDLLGSAEWQAVVTELELRRYFQPGRPGEWKPGPRLNTLFDQQNSPVCPLSIYSNIPNQGVQVEIRDQNTHEVVARANADWLTGPVLTLQGRDVRVRWVDGEALWVTTYQGNEEPEHLRYRALRQHLAYPLARCLPLPLGGQVGEAFALRTPRGWWLFHWLGDLYGQAFRDLLLRDSQQVITPEPALGVVLPSHPTAALWRHWDEAMIADYLQDTVPALERLLNTGPFQPLLPLTLRAQSVIDLFDIPQFLKAVHTLRVVSPSPAQTKTLETVIAHLSG
jgi:ATP-dependent Lhr-like helicase